MARNYLETGARTVVSEQYKDYEIQVITGYDIASNRYPVHVIVLRPQALGGMGFERLQVGVGASEPGALEIGFAWARKAIDAGDFAPSR